MEVIFGSKAMERVLFFLVARNEAYASEIASYFDTQLTPIQNQLYKLENAGVVVSRQVGRTRVFMLNPRYPFIRELKALVEKAMKFLSQDEFRRLTVYRKRPRRTGKPL
jgi:predicted transcriptional regulator